MKHRFIILLFITGLSVIYSLNAQDSQYELSLEQTNMLIEKALQNIKERRSKQCTDTDVLACMDMSKGTCLEIQNDIIDDCLIKIIKSQKNLRIDETLSTKLEAQYKTCSLKIAQKHKVDVKRYLECSPDSGYHE